jgi:hypothetical protein
MFSILSFINSINYPLDSSFPALQNFPQNSSPKGYQLLTGSPTPSYITYTKHLHTAPTMCIYAKNDWSCGCTVPLKHTCEARREIYELIEEPFTPPEQLDALADECDANTEHRTLRYNYPCQACQDEEYSGRPNS